MRASFGGSADLSQTLAFFFEQYQDRLTDLSQRAANRAEENEGARDQDKLNAWQSGDISDKAIIAYLKDRLNDRTNDARTRTQLKDALRNVEDTAAQREIGDNAQDIMDGIEKGTRTWDDLRNFYTRQRRQYRKNDPIYKQLTDQINQVNDRIRDNHISGGIERAQYLFKSQQITGSQAGAMIRNLAAGYKNEDPAKYYQLLSAASEMEQYGGLYGSSRGSSGGSSRSSGGSGGPDIDDLIDRYQAMRNALLSQSDQFEDGRKVGIDSDGNRYLLANDDGTPTQQMEALDHQALETFDLLTHAYREKGDYSAAETTASDKQQYINDHIQPRNTIAPEIQRTHLIDGISQSIELAAESNDPVSASIKVRRAIDGYRKWVENLNTKRTFDPRNRIEGADAVGNPEGRKGLDVTKQTTGAFVKESQDLYNAIEQAVASGNPDAVAQIELPEGMAETFRPVLQQGAALSQVITGLQSGEWTMFADRSGVHPVPTAQNLQGVRVPVDGSGNVLDNAVQVAVQVDGKPVMAWAAPQQVNVWNGSDIHDLSGNVVVSHGQQLSTEQMSALRSASSNGQLQEKVDVNAGVMSAQSILVSDSKGQPQEWFGMNGQWWRPGVDKDVKPAPIVADTDRAASEIAAKMGLDPTPYYQLAKPPEGTERKGGFQQSVEAGASGPRATPLPSVAPRAPHGLLSDQSGRGFGGSFAEKLDQTAQSLGIRTPSLIRQGGMFQNADRSTNLPSIGRGSLPDIRRGGMFEGADLNIAPVRVAPVRIAPFKLNLPRLDIPEPEKIYNPIETATGRRGGLLK